MGYNLNYSSIRTLQTQTLTSVTGWTEQYDSVCTDLLALAGDTAFTGTGADSIKIT